MTAAQNAGYMASSSPPPVSFGGRLREACEEAGLSQLAIAKEMDRSRQTVSAWQRDKHRPTFDELVHLALLVGKSLDWLVLGVRTVPASKKPVMKQVFGSSAED